MDTQQIELLQILEGNFHNFFEAYVQESNDNIFTQNFDFGNKCAFVIRIFFSDILSSQVNHQTQSFDAFYLCPLSILVSNRNIKQYAFWQNNTLDSEVDLTMFKRNLEMQRLSKDAIEKQMIDLKVDKVQQLFQNVLKDKELIQNQSELHNPHRLILKHINPYQKAYNIEDLHFLDNNQLSDNYFVFDYQPSMKEVINPKEENIWLPADFRITALFHSSIPVDTHFQHYIEPKLRSIFNTSMFFSKVIVLQKQKEERHKLKQSQNIVELNTYHHFGSNLTTLQNLLNTDDFGTANLTERQKEILTKSNRYAEVLTKRVTDTLQIFRTYLDELQKEKTESYSISLFSSEYQGIEEDILKKMSFTRPANTHLKNNPTMICQVIKNLIDNMKSELNKKSNPYWNVKNPKIELSISFEENYLHIQLSNNFSKFNAEILPKLGLEPTKSSSSGLGFYFFNAILSWMDAIPKSENERLFFNAQNNENPVGVTISFRLKTLNTHAK